MEFEDFKKCMLKIWEEDRTFFCCLFDHKEAYKKFVIRHGHDCDKCIEILRKAFVDKSARLFDPQAFRNLRKDIDQIECRRKSRFIPKGEEIPKFLED